MEFIIKAAVQLGFNESELLVNQTFMVLIAIQNTNSLSNQEWINKVTSKEELLKVYLKFLNNIY